MSPRSTIAAAASVLVVATLISCASAAITAEDEAGAIGALQSSPYANNVPFLERIIRLAKGLNATDDPVTILLPINAIKRLRNWRSLSTTERDKVSGFHIIQGLYTWKQMRKAPRGKEFETTEGSTIKKVSGTVMPQVRLRGGELLPVVILRGNLYSTATIAVHVISDVLTPPDM